jgi:hypothetical protein
MIDYKITFSETGFNKRYFDKYPKSGKKVYRICDKCKQGKWIKKLQYKNLCQSCSKIGKMMGKDNPSWKPKITLICKQCNKNYKVISSLKNKSNFCSKECQGKWQSINKCGKNSNSWKGGKVTLICEICSKDFKVNKAKKDTAKFCSTKCRNKWVSINQNGENNPNWKNGATSKQQIFRSSKEYKIWRSLIFKRDNYICQECGQWGNKLNVHHILPYRDYQEFRLNINNGITLCEKCHEKTINKEYPYIIKYLNIIYGELKC